MASTDPRSSPSANAWSNSRAPCCQPTVTAVYGNRMVLFKSAENDYVLFGNMSPRSPALQRLALSYLEVLAALARAGVPSRRPDEHNRSEEVVGTGFEPV